MINEEISKEAGQAAQAANHNNMHNKGSKRINQSWKRNKKKDEWYNIVDYIK